MIKVKVVLALVVMLAFLVGCGMPGDPMLDDMYTRNVYPGTTNTYSIGSPALLYSNGYFENLVSGSISYSGGCWEEIVVPANAIGEGWPAPTASNCQSGYAYLFGDGPLPTDETYLHFTFQMPHSWKEGTGVVFEIRFIFNSDQVGTNVRWNVAYSWANVGDPFPVSTNIWALSDPSNNDSLVNQTTKFAAVDGTGKEIGSTLLCYLSRNSSNVLDTYTDTAIFISVGLLYQVDAPGSTSEWGK